jgi:ketosteroid isomerase-like protein
MEADVSNPDIAAVLKARQAVDSALQTGDTKTVLGLVAPDLIVNAPINRVNDFSNFRARLEAQQIAYEAFETKIEFAGVRGDSVVLMGEEIVKPTAASPLAGKIVRRRFTDIWRKIDGAWKLSVRHANVVTAE